MLRFVRNSNCGHGRRFFTVSNVYWVLLAWRLSDLLEETVNGPIKMSLGEYIITGYQAATVQIAIVVTLLLIVFRARQKQRI